MTDNQLPEATPDTEDARRAIQARGNTVASTTIDGKPAIIDGPRSSFAPPTTS